MINLLLSTKNSVTLKYNGNKNTVSANKQPMLSTRSNNKHVAQDNKNCFCNRMLKIATLMDQQTQQLYMKFLFNTINWKVHNLLMLHSVHQQDSMTLLCVQFCPQHCESNPSKFLICVRYLFLVHCSTLSRQVLLILRCRRQQQANQIGRTKYLYAKVNVTHDAIIRIASFNII